MLRMTFYTLYNEDSIQLINQKKNPQKKFQNTKQEKNLK